jgi:membrane protein YqaA with SNARE-associated domain
MWGVFGIAAIPLLPVDVAGIIAGLARLPMWKFLLPVWAGKTVKYVALMLLANVGWPFVSRLV